VEGRDGASDGASMRRVRVVGANFVGHGGVAVVVVDAEIVRCVGEMRESEEEDRSCVSSAGCARRRFFFSHCFFFSLCVRRGLGRRTN
jgi:hypothetical protein